MRPVVPLCIGFVVGMYVSRRVTYHALEATGLLGPLRDDVERLRREAKNDQALRKAQMVEVIVR